MGIASGKVGNIAKTEAVNKHRQGEGAHATIFHGIVFTIGYEVVGASAQERHDEEEPAVESERLSIDWPLLFDRVDEETAVDDAEESILH